MIAGIGADMVEIARIDRFIRGSDTFFTETFTLAERLAGAAAPDRSGWFAARFAAKEAVFKAVAPRTGKKGFDFRLVETLNREDGSPYIHVTDDLRPILQEAGVRELHISITTEGGFALAWVVAEGWGHTG